MKLTTKIWNEGTTSCWTSCYGLTSTTRLLYSLLPRPLHLLCIGGVFVHFIFINETAKTQAIDPSCFCTESIDEVRVHLINLMEALRTRT